MFLNSLTNQLKTCHSKLSAIKVNRVLLKLGLLEEKTCSSNTNGINRKYKVLTEEGLVFGKNMANLLKPEESHPQYDTEKFPELLRLVNDWLNSTTP